MPDAPPPGSPAEARAILLAQLAAMTNMTKALEAHTAALGVYTQRMEALHVTLEALVSVRGGVGGDAVGDILGRLGGILGGDDDDYDPPPRRAPRRRR